MVSLHQRILCIFKSTVRWILCKGRTWFWIVDFLVLFNLNLLLLLLLLMLRFVFVHVNFNDIEVLTNASIYIVDSSVWRKFADIHVLDENDLAVVVSSKFLAARPVVLSLFQGLLSVKNLLLIISFFLSNFYSHSLIFVHHLSQVFNFGLHILLIFYLLSCWWIPPIIRLI